MTIQNYLVTGQYEAGLAVISSAETFAAKVLPSSEHSFYNYSPTVINIGSHNTTYNYDPSSCGTKSKRENKNEAQQALVITITFGLALATFSLVKAFYDKWCVNFDQDSFATSTSKWCFLQCKHSQARPLERSPQSDGEKFAYKVDEIRGKVLGILERQNDDAISRIKRLSALITSLGVALVGAVVISDALVITGVTLAAGTLLYSIYKMIFNEAQKQNERDAYDIKAYCQEARAINIQQSLPVMQTALNQYVQVQFTQPSFVQPPQEQASAPPSESYNYYQQQPQQQPQQLIQPQQQLQQPIQPQFVPFYNNGTSFAQTPIVYYI